jgi:SAM-dependent methyltransferase
VPIFDRAIGVELDYPGYDGITLPFDDASQDSVFVSHCLEHIDDYRTVLADWYRVLRKGGFLVITVPHQHLYERKSGPPSRFNGDHKRFYTPQSLLTEIEESLPPGGYRIRVLRDIDDGFDYTLPVGRHAAGCYEIELVVEKIFIPRYMDALRPSKTAEGVLRFFVSMLLQAVAASRDGRTEHLLDAQAILRRLPLPSFMLVNERLMDAREPAARPSAEELQDILQPVLSDAPFDEDWYLTQYPEIRTLIDGGGLASGHAHFVSRGYFESRLPTRHGGMFDR